MLMIFCLLGCAASQKKPVISPSRYAAIDKQNEYVKMSFPLDEADFSGKTKADVRGKMGEPANILERVDNGITNEMWIYYPAGTNNFIAITIIFEGDIVKKATYESVM
ncbi:MAG: hypothetical protein PHV59_13020 [Victivallales bacterium]|nr:hypothetical protein [Victivallales bacterium]